MNKYDTLQKLGSGGQGVVYKVKDKKDNIFALKKIFCESFEFANRQFEEFSILRMLKHENICNYIEVFIDSEDDSFILSMVMPFCDSGDLDELIRKENVNLKTVYSISLQIAEALAFLHKNNICHRDIKPQNIFLKTENNQLKALLGDFGFSTKFSQDSMKKTQCGTLNFIAPEVISEKSYDGASADVFSFGALLYNFITKKEQTFYAHLLKNETEFLSQISRDLDEASSDKYLNMIVLKLLHKNPKDRLTASEVVEMLKNPITNFIDIEKIVYTFHDDNNNFLKKEKDKLTITIDMKNLHCKKPSLCTFNEESLVYFSEPYVYKYDILSNAHYKVNASIETAPYWTNKHVIVQKQNQRIVAYDWKTGKEIRSLNKHVGAMVCHYATDDYLMTYGVDKRLFGYELKTDDMKNDYKKCLKNDFYLIRFLENTIALVENKTNDIFIMDKDSEDYSFQFQGDKVIQDMIFYHVYLIVLCQNECKIYDISQGKIKKVLKGHTDLITSVRVQQDILITSSLDKTVRFWDIESGNCHGKHEYKHKILKLAQDVVKKSVSFHRIGCMGTIECGHCKKLILLCDHGSFQLKKPFCTINNVVIENLQEKDFCQETGFYSKLANSK